MENGLERASGRLHYQSHRSLLPPFTPAPWPDSEPSVFLQLFGFGPGHGTCFGLSHVGRSGHEPFLNLGLKRPWVFPLALLYLCLCHEKNMAWPAHWAQEGDGRQMEQSHSCCCSLKHVSPAGPQTSKRQIDFFKGDVGGLCMQYYCDRC